MKVNLSRSCSHSRTWSVMVGGMLAVTEELASTCMFRNRMIWFAVIPPLKACLQESREITPTQRFGNLNNIVIE